MNIQVKEEAQSEPVFTHWLDCDTIPKLFRHQCRRLAGRTAHREKDMGIWKSYSWDDYYTHAKWIGLGLAKLGLRRGDCVSILAEDSRQWLYFDMAITCMGAIPSGVYTTDSAAQLAYLVNNSDSRFLVVENDEQLDKFLEARGQMPGLRKIIVIDNEGLRDFSDPDVLFLSQLYDIGRQEAQIHAERFEAEIDKSRPGEIRMLIYTSGTTGRPKGAMITHANMLFQIASLNRLIPGRPSDEQLCFLPLCHVLERLFSVETQLAYGTVVNFAESPETVFDNLREVSPQVFVAVPRVWEKIFSRLQILRKEATPIGRWALDRATAAGARRAQFLIEGAKAPAWARWHYVGSSRVDLQACKLEYSIVSPK